MVRILTLYSVVSFNCSLWRLQCGHCFHALCWDRHAQSYIDRALPGGANEAPCGVCRGPGLVVAHFPYAGHHEGYAAQIQSSQEASLANAAELRRLREEVQALQSLQAAQASAPPAGPTAIAAPAAAVPAAAAPAASPQDAGLPAATPTNNSLLDRLEAATRQRNRHVRRPSAAQSRVESPHSARSRTSVDSERARFIRTDTFMINADDVTTLDEVGGNLPASLCRQEGAVLSRTLCDHHALAMSPITSLENAAYNTVYTELPRHQWVLEQRRLRGCMTNLPCPSTR